MAFPTLRIASGKRQNKQSVKDAQYLLKGNNRFKESYYSGPIDGDFGAATGAATYRAKFWSGYPLKKCDHVFGPVLYSYLLPLTSKSATKLPITYRLRRTARLKAKKKQEQQKTLGVKAFELGVKYINYREGPNNDNIFGAFFGINHNPWCGCFVSYCYTKVGKRIFLPYVPNIVSWARSGENGLYIVNTPKKGDLVCFDWTGNGIFDHVEFVESFDGTTIHTLGGNTLPPGGAGDQGNGGGVYRNARPASIHHAFIRIAGAN